jgi:hypothetical protein
MKTSLYLSRHGKSYKAKPAERLQVGTKVTMEEAQSRMDNS